MAAEELKKEVPNEGVELKERAKIENPARLLQDSLDGLDKFGGFQLIKGLIKGIDNLDPSRKAVKNIFLKESDYANERSSLKEELKQWILILNGETSDPTSVIELCKKECSTIEERMQENLKTIHEEIKKLEVAYRSLNSFFANAGQGKIDCITVMNVDKGNLWSHDSNDTLAIRKELEEYYDRLNLKNNYSLLVIPGYLGEVSDDDRKDFPGIKPTINMWAETAYRNKVLMITDFRDLDGFDVLKMSLDKTNLQDQDAKLSNVVMTCNYLFGRKKSEKEEDDLYIPASAALAGRMTNTDEIVIAQGAAGKKYGTLSNVKGARLDLRKSEIAALIDLGVVPMVEEDGRTMAFSNRSLYNGATIGLQEYPIVRTFDWIGKVFQNFFNDEAFTNWNSQVKGELQQAIHDFLSDYKGPGQLIENYNLKKLEQDPKTKDIKIEVELKPFFAAKNFFIELTGHNGQAGVEWDQNVK